MGILTKGLGVLADWIEAGYPEEVAKRIVSGELPMDEASRLARAQEQGYGPVLYRGQPDRPLTSNQDIWASSSPDVAQTYADNFTVSHRDALGEDGVVIPLRTNASNLADVNARGKSWHVVESNNRKIPNIESGVLKGTDRISEAVRDSGVYDGTVFRNIPDDAVRLRGAEKADTYNILGSRPDVNIRHADAAYDPQYTGSNIMGGALAGAVGLGALSQSEEADASIAALARRGLKVIKNGDDYDLIDEATGDYAGKMTTEELLNGNMWSLDTQLNDAYRGQGIGNEYYDAVEEVSGKKMQPSPWLSADGVRFWGRRDPEALADMVRNDEFYDGQNHEQVLGYLRDVEHPGFSHDVPGQVKLRGFRDSYAVPPLLAAGTGALALGAQPKAEAALKSEGLEKATGFLDETIRSARHAAGPLSFLVPYGGISNFAKKWNADEDLTWQDYMGLLDF